VVADQRQRVGVVHWFPDQGAAAEDLGVILEAGGEGFWWWGGIGRGWQPCTESWFLEACRTDNMADLYGADRGLVERDMDPERN
jgi:hypothetical protein